jgi:hypothetical protein
MFADCMIFSCPRPDDVEVSPHLAHKFLTVPVEFNPLEGVISVIDAVARQMVAANSLPQAWSAL